MKCVCSKFCLLVLQPGSIMDASWPVVGKYDKILIQSAQYVVDSAREFRKRLKAYTSVGKGKVW